jgi:cell division protein FtsX
MKDILECMENLNKQLSKHPDIKEVYRPPNKKELKEFVETINDSMCEESWNSMVTNLAMLDAVPYDEDERKETKNAVNALKEFAEVIKDKKNFNKALFSDNDKKLLLACTSALVMLFGVAFKIEREFSLADLASL